MSIPIVYSVCRAYPQIEFTMLTSPHASNLFIEKPANLVIISAQIRGRHSGIKGLYTLYRELRNSSFNIIADLHDVLRSKILRFLFALSGCKVAHINKGRKEKRKPTSIFFNTSNHPRTQAKKTVKVIIRTIYRSIQ